MWQLEGNNVALNTQQTLNPPLNRMKVAVDETQREEQARFRKDRSCIDQIATLRIIVEQTIEW